MDFCGEFITHKAFGRGQIVALENHCMTVIFQETNEKKKFIYPDAFGTFLILENKKLAKQIQEYQNEIAQSIAVTQKNSEANRALEKEQKANNTKKATRKPSQKKKIIK